MTALLALLLLSAPNAKEADALFTRARAALKAGDPARACPLFERSHALDPALGTLLNLADCHEATGRRVQAFLAFNEAAAWAARNHETAREEIARARAAALKQRLSWVALAPAVNTPGLTVTVNDVPVALGASAQSVPVDAGAIELIATAPDREPWRAQVVVREGETVAVTVPVLAAVSELKQPNAWMATPSFAVTPPPPPARSRAPGFGLLIGGAALAAAGAAGLAYSADTYDRFQRQQGPNGPRPTVSRNDLETLRTAYPVSWAVTGVGVAAAAAGGFISFTGSF